MDYLHRIFGIYATRDEAEQVRQKLFDQGIAADQFEILDEPDDKGHIEPNSDEVRNETLTGGAVGTVIGGAAGALGEVALAAANVSLFLASPVIGTLTMIGWGAAAGGVLGGFIGAGNTGKENFADLVRDAIQHGYTVLIVYARTEEQTTLAQSVIGASVQQQVETGKAD
jgi:hypothetical protein